MEMAGDHQRTQVAVRGGKRIRERKPKLEIRCAVVGRAIAPLAVVDTVGRWKQLERVDAKLDKLRTAHARDVKVGEVLALCVGIDEGEHVANRFIDGAATT